MIKRSLTYAAGLLATISSAGCATPASADMQPAVLTNPSAQTRAELAGTVSKALNGRTVRLATDVLTRDNRLIIDPVQGYRGGNPIDGRRMDRPDHFYLMTSGQDCWLKHQQSEQLYALKTAKCAPQPQAK